MSLELHRRLAVRDQSCGARRALLRRRREEAVLERTCVEQPLEVFARPRPAGVAEVVRDRRRLHHRLAAELRGQVVPVERIRPLVLAANGNRRDPRLLELGDGGEELRPRLRRRRDACLLEELLVVPEANDADAVRDCVLLAVDLPARSRAADALDPRLDVLRQVGHLAGLLLVDEAATAPTLEHVRRAVRLQCDRDLGLELLVLQRHRLDRDARVLPLELGGDVLVQLHARALRHVVPPHERLALLLPARGGRGRRQQGRRGCRDKGSEAQQLPDRHGVDSSLCRPGREKVTARLRWPGCVIAGRVLQGDERLSTDIDTVIGIL